MIRAAIAALALLTAPALADEAWISPSGPLIYEVDMGHIAVLSFPAEVVGDAAAGARAQVYVPGLGGNFDDRSVHAGYWAVSGGPVCTASLTTPDGVTTQRWGRAQIIFDRAAFPTGFTMMIGYCMDDPSIPLRADLN